MGIREWICASCEIATEYLFGRIRYDECLSKLLTKMIRHNILLIKVFQSLSSNPNISQSVRKLFREQTDHAIHTDYDIDYKLLAQITTEYKICLDSSSPINSGMIAVVFKGTLANGDKVVIKMKRKHIYERVSDGHKDFVGIYNKLRVVLRPFKRYYDILMNLQSFVDTGDYILSQCVFVDEISTMKQMYEDCRETPKFIIPKVLNRQETDTDYIVMDFLEGCDCFSVRDEDKVKYATEFFHFTWHTLFTSKFVHTDLHPGNIICMSDNRIGIIDFGMKQEMTDKLRSILIAMLTTGVDRERFPDKKIDCLKLMVNVFEPKLEVEKLSTEQYDKINGMCVDMFHATYKGDLDESKFNKLLQIVREITNQTLIIQTDIFKQLMGLSMCQATARLFLPDEDVLKQVMKLTLKEAME